MLKYAILIGGLFSIYNLCGQTTFSKLYWNYPYTTLGQGVAYDNTNIYITGRGASYIDGFLYQNHFFIKVDHLGELTIVNNIIGDAENIWGDNYASGFEFIPDSTLVFAGNFYSLDTLFPPFNEEHNGLIYKYNLNGDTIFTKKYIGDGYTEFAQLVFDPVTNRIYAGHSTKDTVDGIGKAYTVCLDTDGNIIWEQKEGDGEHVELGGLLDIFNGNIISGGIIR